MMKTELLFVNFDAGESERTFRLNTRIRGVRSLYLKMIAYEEVGVNTMVASIDNAAMAIASENLAGFPIPLLGKGGSTGSNDGGHEFDFPLLLAHCNWPSLKDVRIRLRNLDGSSFSAHQGVSMWLECRCEKEVYDGDSVRAEQWLKNTALSGIGQHDYRWDYVPSAQEVAQKLATLEERFSILSGEK